MAKRPELDEEEAAKLMHNPRVVRSDAHPVTSFKDIAETLNAMGITTPRGRRWNARSVARVLEERAAQQARNEPE